MWILLSKERKKPPLLRDRFCLAPIPNLDLHFNFLCISPFDHVLYTISIDLD